MTATVHLDGREISVPSGISVAAALLRAGVTWSQPQPGTGVAGLFCGMGACYGCVADIDGRKGVRTCITAVADGMRIDSVRGGGDG